MLPELDGADGGRRMVMIGSGDQYGIDVLVALIEHLAIVVIGLRFARLLRQLVHYCPETLLVDINTGNEAFAGCQARIAAALSSTADDGDAELRIRRLISEDCRQACEM